MAARAATKAAIFTTSRIGPPELVRVLAVGAPAVAGMAVFADAATDVE